MSTHPLSIEAAWLSGNYASLQEYQHDGRAHWVAVVGQSIVDDDENPQLLVERVISSHGQGCALFASVIAERLG